MNEYLSLSSALLKLSEWMPDQNPFLEAIRDHCPLSVIGKDLEVVCESLGLYYTNYDFEGVDIKHHIQEHNLEQCELRYYSPHIIATGTDYDLRFYVQMPGEILDMDKKFIMSIIEPVVVRNT